MIPKEDQIKWYDIRSTTDLAGLLNRIHAEKQWAYLAYQTTPAPSNGWLEVYVNGVRVYSTNSQIEGTKIMKDYLTGKRRIAGT